MRVTPISLAYNTVYLVEARGLHTLVDTGPDYAGARELLTAALAGSRPGLVVATHSHNDHAGLGRWWQSQGVPVAIGVADHRLARAPHFTISGEFEAFESFVAQCGTPPEWQREILAGLDARRGSATRAATKQAYPAARTGDRWPSGLRFEPFEPDRVLEGDAELVEGLIAISCPGHTPGNLVVLATAEGLLFSGDQLLPDITPTPGIQFVPGAQGGWDRFPSLPSFAASLRRLCEFELVRCYPGHGTPFEEVASVIDENLRQIEQRTERVLAELGRGSEATVHALAERIYPRALRRRWWQIVATVQGHLDLLAEQGRASGVDGRWSAAR